MMASSLPQRTRNAFSSIDSDSPYGEIDLESVPSCRDSRGEEENSLFTPPELPSRISYQGYNHSNFEVIGDYGQTPSLLTLPGSLPSTTYPVASPPQHPLAHLLAEPQSSLSVFFIGFQDRFSFSPRSAQTRHPSSCSDFSTSQPSGAYMQCSSPTSSPLGAFEAQDYNPLTDMPVSDYQRQIQENTSPVLIQPSSTMNYADKEAKPRVLDRPTLVSASEVESLDFLCDRFSRISLAELDLMHTDEGRDVALEEDDYDGSEKMGDIGSERGAASLFNDYPADLPETDIDVARKITEVLPLAIPVYPTQINGMSDAPQQIDLGLAEDTLDAVNVSPESQQARLVGTVRMTAGYLADGVPFDDDQTYPSPMIVCPATQAVSSDVEYYSQKMSSGNQALPTYSASCPELNESPIPAVASSDYVSPPGFLSFNNHDEFTERHTANKVESGEVVRAKEPVLARKRVRFSFGNDTPRLFRNSPTLLKSRNSPVHVNETSEMFMQPDATKFSTADIKTLVRSVAMGNKFELAQAIEAGAPQMFQKEEIVQHEGSHITSGSDGNEETNISPIDNSDLVKMSTSLIMHRNRGYDVDVIFKRLTNENSGDDLGEVKANPYCFDVAVRRFNPYERLARLRRRRLQQKDAPALLIPDGFQSVLLAEETPAPAAETLVDDNFTDLESGPTSSTPSSIETCVVIAEPAIDDYSELEALGKIIPGFLAFKEGEVAFSLKVFFPASFALPCDFSRLKSLKSLVPHLPAAILYTMVMITIAYPSIWL